MQFVFHAQKTSSFFFGELVNGNAGPERQHIGDRFFINLVEEIDAGVLHFLLFGFLLREQFLFAIAQATSFFELLRLDGFLLFGNNRGDFVFKFLEIGRCFHALDAQT
ncbi:unannotated protein [freshwater metagenome]|uniref:Unannotated protein n=1 Tax=freshwater metagenome TaxID=449393 RepID=A0A6J7JDD2_9ZZZZ